MKYIEQWFRRLIFWILISPCFMLDVFLVIITFGLWKNKDGEDLLITKQLGKLWK